VLTPAVTGNSKTEALTEVALDAAHESGHTFGLEHTASTMDIMHPSLDPSMTGFLDQNMQLTDGASQCTGGSTQDSAARLKSNIGAAHSGGGPATPKPTVAFVYPKSGATVGQNAIDFKVIAQPPAGGTLSDIEVTVFGQSLASGTTSPVQQGFGLQQTGPITLVATATDGQGNSAVTQVNLTIDTSSTLVPQNCSADSDCNAPLVCNASTNECDWTSTPATGGGTPDGGSSGGGNPGQGGPTPSPAAPGAVGASCMSNDNCDSKICASIGGQHFCSQHGELPGRHGVSGFGQRVLLRPGRRPGRRRRRLHHGRRPGRNAAWAPRHSPFRPRRGKTTGACLSAPLRSQISL
jgi:hypothetical protein